MGNLHDRVAVITGASSGLGEAMAQRFAGAGASVVVNYHRNESGAATVVEAIRDSGGQAIAHQADVTQSQEATGLMDRAVREYGRLDILVNNAGMRSDALVLRMREEDWQAVLTTNLTGAFLCIRPALKTMVRQRYGRILNIASVVGVVGNAGQANYAAAKAGLIGLTRATAREVATRGITVNVLAPGFFHTRMTADVTEEMREFVMSQIPMGRWGDPEETAAAAAFLVSHDAAYITGQVLNVDGGLVMA
ncbi:MAG: 3-oxoacyl-[acyl-carrier-protein] reductase [Dehalococcoidia bacterium]|nr:3-oxoacyl-[acyl-carrier-protein] reductase [Dehalococcoidia bacterium]